MRILERYINTSIIRNYLSAVLIFSFLYILIEITSNLDEIIDRQVPIPILVEYYLYFLPIIFTQISAICSLLGVLFSFSNLHNNNEIIAMRASGMNFWHITRPGLIFALSISALVFCVNEKVIPLATEKTKEIHDENFMLLADRMNKKHIRIENLTFYGMKNRLFFVDTYNIEQKALEGVTILEFDQDQNIRQKIVALRGGWTGIAWKFFQTQITIFEKDGPRTSARLKVYNEKLMDIKESPKDFLRQRIKVDRMNLRELGDYIERFSTSGAVRAINNLKVDFHHKIAFPFSNFVIVLVGLPFAMMVKNRKGMTFTSLGIALLIAFIFLIIDSVCIAFGKSGYLPPIVAAWLAPALFIGTGVSLIEYNFE